VSRVSYLSFHSTYWPLFLLFLDFLYFWILFNRALEDLKGPAYSFFSKFDILLQNVFQMGPFGGLQVCPMGSYGWGRGVCVKYEMLHQLVPPCRLGQVITRLFFDESTKNR